MKKLTFLFLLVSTIAFGQSERRTSSEIYDDLLRLQNDVTVMYLAAHPDDENTRMMSWLSHEKHVDAVYLSLTRGDGGQNLIGTEKGEMLGLLRTQELLEARKVDKGRQWFTRAVDFGYSKTTEDTYDHWDKEKVLGDVVWGIRVNQPEVIITRFDPDSNGKTHGHHTASAQLAVEAYELAADPKAYPEQLKYVKPWQVKRLFFNTSWWFYGSKEKFAEVDKSDMISLDVGKYYAHLGVSNNEISSLSRSKHACQGFGSALQRGSHKEWLRLLKGNMPKQNDMLDGINIGWENPQIQQQIDKTIANFDFINPKNSIKHLIELYNLVQQQNENDKRLVKIQDLILATQGIYTEWTTKEKFGTKGDTLTTTFEIANRGTDTITCTLKEKTLTVAPNTSLKEKIEKVIETTSYSSPYWLNDAIDNNFYVVDDLLKLGHPELTNYVTLPLAMTIENTKFEQTLSLQQKTVDPSIGELYEPFYVVPAFTVNFAQPHYLFKKETQSIEVKVTAFVPNATATVSLKATNGWKTSKAQTIQTKNASETQSVYFEITPPSNFKASELTATVTYDNQHFIEAMEIMDYDHIDRQIWLHDAQTRLQNLDIKIPNVTVAYIQGSGDVVPDALRTMGVQIDELDVNQWDATALSKYDVVLLGIRVFNKIKAMKFIKEDLWSYVKNGGVVITQYNTHRGIGEIAPYRLKISRDRISQEKTALKMLVPNHNVFTTPNKISDKDFENWVQERGLYFANEWGEEFTPLLEGNDLGETPKQGMLLVSDYGKGKYVYTGLSFFRELPAGVPGAYRLMMNLLALGEK